MDGTKEAGRGYRNKFGVAIAAYGVVLAVVIPLLNGMDPGSGWRVPLALLPMVPLVLALLAFVRYLGRMDELQRRIQLEAFSFAFGGTALLTFGYGFLQSLADFPQLSWFFVWPVMAVLWMAGKARADRQYR